MGLQREELLCSYGYIKGTQEAMENKSLKVKDFGSAYNILKYNIIQGDSASLDSKYSSISVKCVNENK